MEHVCELEALIPFNLGQAVGQPVEIQTAHQGAFVPGNVWRNSVIKWSSKPLKRQKVPVPGDVGNFRWSTTRE